MNLSPSESENVAVPRRLFISGLLMGGTALVLPTSTEAYPFMKRTRLAQGPLVDVIPSLRDIVRDPEVAQFLMNITPAMGEIGALTVPQPPGFQKVDIDEEERASIKHIINDVVGMLANDLPVDQQLSSQEIKKIKHKTKEKVFGFLCASDSRMQEIADLWQPLNQASVPIANMVGNAFVVYDAAGPNLAVVYPTINAIEQDKLLLKLAILAGLVAAIVAAVLAAIEIKVPAVKTDKLVPIIAKAIQNPAGRTAFLTMIEIIKKEGATLGEKVGAIMAFLKTLWNLGALKEILVEMLTGFSIFDLVLTIAGIAAVFLTAGTSFVLKFTGIAVGLLASIISAGAAYQNLQKT